MSGISFQTICDQYSYKQISFQDSYIILYSHISSHNQAIFKNLKSYNGHQQLFKQSIIFFWQFEQGTFSQLLFSRYFFGSCFFLLVNQKDSNVLISHYNRLNNTIKNLLVNQDTILIIADASIKNNMMSCLGIGDQF